MRCKSVAPAMVPGRRLNYVLATTIVLSVALGACEPPRVYRMPVPPSSNTILGPRVPQTPAPIPPSPPAEVARKPLPQETKIREQDLKSRAPSANSPARETKEPTRQSSINENRATPESTVAPAPAPPPLPDDSSLLAKITPGISPQRAASLRLTDEGSKLLDAGELGKALTRLEKTIVIDSSNAYGYFYLAKAQYRLGRYQQSLNFLDVAESRLSGEPFWLAEVHALRGENYRALGQGQKAESSYLQALRLNSGNHTAADALTRLQAETQPVNK
jgi:tetratricopeptide repeat protein